MDGYIGSYWRFHSIVIKVLTLLIVVINMNLFCKFKLGNVVKLSPPIKYDDEIHICTGTWGVMLS